MLEEIFIRSWWVVLFILACFWIYESKSESLNKDFANLYSQYLELQKEELRGFALRENLLLQINSQSDPEWMELTLMKGLGLVPETQTKVIFLDN